eukprot:259687_1
MVLHFNMVSMGVTNLLVMPAVVANTKHMLKRHVVKVKGIHQKSKATYGIMVKRYMIKNNILKVNKYDKSKVRYEKCKGTYAKRTYKGTYDKKVRVIGYTDKSGG